MEARKLLTVMAVGSVGVLYATLTGKDAPTLAVCGKALAIISIVSMGVSAACGFVAWRADAAWAYWVGKEFAKNPNPEKFPEDKWWHRVKKLFDYLQLIAFAFGIVAAMALTIKVVQSK